MKAKIVDLAMNNVVIRDAVRILNININAVVRTLKTPAQKRNLTSVG